LEKLIQENGSTGNLAVLLAAALARQLLSCLMSFQKIISDVVHQDKIPQLYNMKIWKTDGLENVEMRII